MAKMAQSIHGIYLLNAICTIPPTSSYEVEDLGKLLAAAFVWIEAVEYTSNSQMKTLIKQYRQQTLSWIMQLMKFDCELYISCLLPDPPLYARVGHPWNMLTSVVRKDLEIMQRLSTLMVHELIPENVCLEFKFKLIEMFFQKIFFSVFIKFLKTMILCFLNLSF